MQEFDSSHNDKGSCYCQSCSLGIGSSFVEELADELSEYGIGMDMEDLHETLVDFGNLFLQLGVKIALYEHIKGSTMALKEIESDDYGDSQLFIEEEDIQGILEIMEQTNILENDEKIEAQEDGYDDILSSFIDEFRKELKKR